MDPKDFFRGFFFGNDDRRRNPFQGQEGRDEEMPPFNGSGNGIRVEVFTDPLEMSRFFDHQMDQILKGFFGLQGYEGQSRFGRFIEDEDDVEEGSRHFMLKDGDKFGFSDSQGRKDADWDDKINDGNGIAKLLMMKAETEAELSERSRISSAQRLEVTNGSSKATERSRSRLENATKAEFAERFSLKVEDAICSGNASSNVNPTASAKPSKTFKAI